MTTSFPVATLNSGPEERADPDRLVKGPNAYRTISEVADELHVPQHVLRFWETRFPEVKPLKRGGGRRYYSPADIETLRRITDLLYVQGYTIKGVQRVLKEQMADPATPTVPAMTGAHPASPSILPSPIEETRGSFEIPAFQPTEPTQTHPDRHDGEGALTDPGTTSSAMVDEFRASDLQAEDSQAASVAEMPADKDSDRTVSQAEGSEGTDDDHDAPQGHPDGSLGPQETILDPGEETSATSVTAVEDDLAETTSPEGQLIDLPGVNEELITILQDELVALRTEHGRWRQERRALRLALEDVLGELDSLRQMLPQA
ncbi:MerR family transcriptional regulator [Asaia bogorensis]|uniref:MerR family transcriptional regulator n=1 Tax=Asaia bogorensis TaxID=91915 RepID=UPI001F11A6DF|nr:MerR family transcriptional regulator [Asaia bogorensis]